MAPESIHSTEKLATSDYDERTTSSTGSSTTREFVSYANVIPQPQGLYDPEYEKDACGVGFIAHIKGAESHAIVHDASGILCSLTHRGAVGADARDGDGAGVMSGIPHAFLTNECRRLFDVELPPRGRYAVGNIFFKPDDEVLRSSQATFEGVARSLGLTVLCWRAVPRDNSVLGSVSVFGCI